MNQLLSFTLSKKTTSQKTTPEHSSSSSLETFDVAPLQDQAAALVEAAKRAGAQSCDAVVAASRASGVEVRDGQVEEVEGAENNAFSLRVFIGKRSASVSANMISNVQELAERAVAMAKVSPEDPYGGLAEKERLAQNIPDLDLFDPTRVDFDQMREQALACEDAALAVEGVTKSSGASFSRALGGSVLATSDGFLGRYRSSRFSLSVSVVAGEGLNMQRDYDFDGMRYQTDLRSAADIGAMAGKRAVERLNPRQVKTQSVPVIFDPRVARGMVSHLASAVNGASIVRKTSFLRDDMGRQIFAPNVTIVDEPHLIRGSSSRPFDAEGVAGETLNLIENGVLKNWLLDTATAKELGLETNGHANRAGSGTAPGDSNLTLLAGDVSRQDMLSSIKQGFYVTELIGHGVNLTTGDYSRGASGFWIENGEITYAVSEVTIAGQLRDMFASMQPASDLDKRFGTNAPTILLEGMTIAGQ